MHLGRDPACGTQAVQADEAGGVVLVAVPRLRDRVGFHRGIHLFIQTAAANLLRRPARARFPRRCPSGDRR